MELKQTLKTIKSLSDQDISPYSKEYEDKFKEDYVKGRYEDLRGRESEFGQLLNISGLILEEEMEWGMKTF